MWKKEKFAVYTSFYNCFKYVDQIFESVLSIVYHDRKWFITDDYSTDDIGDFKEQRNRIEEVYLNKTIKFNLYSGWDLYLIIANYTFNKNSLCIILEKIKSNNKKARFIVYYLDKVILF